MPSAGFETADSSNQAAADPLLRPHGTATVGLVASVANGGSCNRDVAEKTSLSFCLREMEI